jgi:hypothetical protein
MIKTNLPFNFAIAWVFIITLVSESKVGMTQCGLMYVAVRVPAYHSVGAANGPCNQPFDLCLPSLPHLQRGGLPRSADLLVASSDDLVRSSFSNPVAPSHHIHPTLPPLQCSIFPIAERSPTGHLLRLDIYVDSPCLWLVERLCRNTWDSCRRVART